VTVLCQGGTKLNVNEKEGNGTKKEKREAKRKAKLQTGKRKGSPLENELGSLRCVQGSQQGGNEPAVTLTFGSNLETKGGSDGILGDENYWPAETGLE